MSRIKEVSKYKKKLFIGIGIIIVILLASLMILFLVFKDEKGGNEENPIPSISTLTIETPQRLSASKKEEFTIDVRVSSFGNAVYPAASMSIAFDASKLEFLRVEEGNVFIRNDEDKSQSLPEWSCNTEQANKYGVINIMYLDVTGGKNSFSQQLLDDEDNVVLRLTFRLRGSARPGDVYDLFFEDAVFAASDESQSLAMTKNTLNVRNGKLVIGEENETDN